ncbi:MAG: universal stress protein [Anaerolineales bacterium]|jgi:nucleotide-binding universal stress UspA family protein
MFSPILVPLDGSSLAESVLPHVKALAQLNDSQVILVRVLDQYEGCDDSESVDPLDWQIRKVEAWTYLEQVATRLVESGLQVQIEILEGNAAERIVEYVQLNDISLIVLSSHGQSGLTGWNVSSVVQKVILRARISMMIVRAYVPQSTPLDDIRYYRILVPLDGSQRAESVLPHATAMARSQDTQVLLTHVVRRPEMPRRTPLPVEDIELIERITERNRAEAEKYLAELKSRLDINIETRLLIDPSVTSALHELIEKEQIDIVYMTAHGFTGDTRRPYGSTVVSFIAYGTTPLLIFQDLRKDRILLTQAELAAKERGGR